MTSRNETGFRTFTAGGALGRNLRVTLSSSKLALCAATDAPCVGVTERAAFALNEAIPVHLPSAEGTRLGVAAGTFSADALLYAAADGKIDDSGTIIVGVALEEATSSGQVVEYLPLPEVLVGD